MVPLSLRRCGEPDRTGGDVSSTRIGARKAAVRLCVLLQLRARIYFSAYRHLTGENPEFVLFLGDYIYETIEQYRPIVRRHSDGIEAATLPTYRNRYAQYRLDADLQELHAQVPAIVTWDDHEVQNDYADKWSETFDYEHMPVRQILSRPNGPLMRVYDRFTLGDLIEISVIDGRQYRSRQACYAPPNKGGAHLETNASCPERLDAGRTMLGFGQEAWLYAGLARSKARWNLIAQDVLMAQLRRNQDGIDALDRRLERLSRQSRAASAAHPQSQDLQSGGDFRRHSFLLRQ